MPAKLYRIWRTVLSVFLQLWHWAHGSGFIVHNERICSRERNSLRHNIQVMPSVNSVILVLPCHIFNTIILWNEGLLRGWSVWLTSLYCLRTSSDTAPRWMVLCFSAANLCSNLCLLYLLSECSKNSFPCKDKGWIIRLLCQFLKLPDSPVSIWLGLEKLFWM